MFFRHSGLAQLDSDDTANHVTCLALVVVGWVEREDQAYLFDIDAKAVVSFIPAFITIHT